MHVPIVDVLIFGRQCVCTQIVWNTMFITRFVLPPTYSLVVFGKLGFCKITGILGALKISLPILCLWNLPQ